MEELIFLINPKILTLVLIVLTVFVVFLAIKSIQTEGLEKIRSVVYGAFILAEKHFKQGENKLKFEYVVDVAKKALPPFFRPFIDEQMLRKIIQMWFNLCKDLLDDGKINKSNEG